MRKLRVLTLVREGLVPPENLEGQSKKDILKWKAEYDVLHALEQLGHEAEPLGVYDDLAPIRDKLRDMKPHIVFMQLEEFHGVVTYDHAIVSYLELMRQPYTGCNPRGMLLSKDKALAKKILTYHRIPTPQFAVFPRGRRVRRPKKLAFPLFVKSIVEDASFGISQASLVHDDAALIERVEFVHTQAQSDAIAEQYIDGREFYMSVIGNQRLKTFPPWEMLFTKMPDDVARIATAKVKWDSEYQKRHGIKTAAANNLPEGVAERMARICKRVYRALNMSGYARMDMRMNQDGRIFVLEANANPNIEYGDDFAESVAHSGTNYEALIQRILNLGMAYQAPWQI
jgi:D-alanine-D-alanine ligase